MSDAGPDARRKVKVLLFGASLRAESLNASLARLAGQVAEDHGVTVDCAGMRDFDCPSFDGDVESTGKFPAGAYELRRRLEASDALIIASPEYNASMPGILKNGIDWVSRMRPQPFNERHALLMSASPSLVGGNRGLWSLRVPLEHLGTRVYPEMFSLANASKALVDGDIADPALKERFVKTIEGFLALVEAAKHYPCMKRRWIEFLGEPHTAEPVEATS